MDDQHGARDCGAAASACCASNFRTWRRREGKKSGAPDREPVLLDAWRKVVAETGSGVFIGGKSMGGRMASMVADELPSAAWSASATRSIRPARRKNCAPNISRR